MSTRTFWN